MTTIKSHFGVSPVIIIFGQRTYGKVDRVPGVCYIITVFAHLNFLPLAPVRSYVVVEGTEQGGEFRGKEIPVCLKSVLAGYIRVWCGAAAIIAGLIATFGLSAVANELRLNALASLAIWGAAIGGLIAIFVGGKFGACVQIAVHLTSAILWYVITDAVGQNVKAGRGAEGPLLALFIANVGLLCYGLTRLMDHASPARQRELLQELGVEVPPEDGEEPREYEDWDENEDRRKRGG